MKLISPKNDWPASWNYSYGFDLMEVYNRVERSQIGYFYAYQNRRKKTIDLIEERVSLGSSILDIAAAQGNFSLTLAEMNYRVTWNDLRGDLIDYVKLKHEHGDLQYAPGNSFDLKFSEQFDAVLITEIIEHVAHPDEFLAKVAQLVKPGGYIIMTTPNGAYFRNRLPKFSDCSDPSVFEAVQFAPDSDGHIFLLHREEVFRLAAKAGLSVDKVTLFTTPLTNGHVKLGKILRWLPKQFVELIEYVSQGLPRPVQERLMVQMGVRFQKKSENG